MRTCLYYILFALAAVSASAQSITGYSTVSIGVMGQFCNRVGCPPPVLTPILNVYTDTEEDYTAALYYDVENTTAIYGVNGSLITTISAPPGNPTAPATYSLPMNNANGATDGIFSAYTTHILDFFYIAAAASYYDPYGYSGFTNGTGDGGYGSGYYFNVYVNLYLQLARVVLGQTYSLANNSTQDTGASATAARAYSVLYQTFIPPDVVISPADDFTCVDPFNAYGGDNRGFNPLLGSARAFEQISLGVGGLFLPNQLGAFDTGITHQYAHDALDANGHLLPAALGDGITGDCHYLKRLAKAPRTTLTQPVASYSGGVASTTFLGKTGNPLEPSPPIDFNATVQLAKVGTTVYVSGQITHDCYPAHEVSVGITDVYAFMPAGNDVTVVAPCLAGVGALTVPITKTFTSTP